VVSVDEGASLIDCDVHCAVESTATLAPYLDEHWREWLRIGNLVTPPAVATSYPAWCDMVRTDGKELTLDRLRSEVLDRSTLAILTCYYGLESFTHPYLAGAIGTAVNRWVQEEWLDQDDRLRASAVISPQYPEAAVAEIERIGDDKRFVQILVTARAASPYGNQRYWPIWRAAAERDLPIAITFGGGTGSPPSPVNWLGSYFEEYSTATLNFQSHILSMAVSGIFDLHPNLKVVVMESGWTWLPALLWRMDQEWKAFQREVPWMTGPPSEYVRRHFRFTTAPVDAPGTQEHLGHVLEQLGSDELLMFGSDYPHRYGDEIDRVVDLLSPEQVERLRWRNAAECYGLESQVAAVAGP
jgi:predicted TIM-barrel fold metal-dependent hydrolase